MKWVRLSYRFAIGEGMGGTTDVSQARRTEQSSGDLLSVESGGKWA